MAETRPASHAIIVVGNERRFIDDANAFARYLGAEAACAATVLRGAYRTPDQLLASLRRGVRKAKGRPLLVAYFGHGMPDHWSYALEHQRKPLELPFKDLVPVLAKHDGPLAIVSDTCHADGMRPFLEKARLAGRCLFIAACPKDDVSYGGLWREVAARWRKREVFETIREREEVCVIERIGYVPPWHARLRDWWGNLLISVRNRLVSKAKRRPNFIRLRLPPNGWGASSKVTESAIGLRWGATLDHHFFHRKP